MRHIIDQLQKGTLTGRGTEEIANFKNFMHTFGVDKMFGADFGNITNYEQLRTSDIEGR